MTYHSWTERETKTSLRAVCLSFLATYSRIRRTKSCGRSVLENGLRAILRCKGWDVEGQGPQRPVCAMKRDILVYLGLGHLPWASLPEVSRGYDYTIWYNRSWIMATPIPVSRIDLTIWVQGSKNGWTLGTEANLGSAGCSHLGNKNINKLSTCKTIWPRLLTTSPRPGRCLSVKWTLRSSWVH